MLKMGLREGVSANLIVEFLLLVLLVMASAVLAAMPYNKRVCVSLN
ncbi:hypothetical protein [Agarivorans litoreus]|nr:hypothetical protein [Agarivorans litoreus]